VKKLEKQTLAETWTEVRGDEVGASAPKHFFDVPPKCDIYVREFQYLSH